jgi:hypothetical protein
MQVFWEILVPWAAALQAAAGLKLPLFWWLPLVTCVVLLNTFLAPVGCVVLLNTFFYCCFAFL